MRKKKLWPLLTTLILLAACGPGALKGAAPTPTTEPVPTEIPAEEIFAQATEALKGLESYCYMTLFTFETENREKGGSSVQSIKLEGEYVAPDREHAAWTDLNTGEGYEAISIGAKTWLRVTAGGSWGELPSDYVPTLTHPTFHLGNPLYGWELFYSSPPQAFQLVGREVASGIPCLHYRSSEKVEEAFLKGEAQGDIWMAEEGFPVRFAFESKAYVQSEEVFTQWSMEIRDVNQPISIEPPI